MESRTVRQAWPARGPDHAWSPLQQRIPAGGSGNVMHLVGRLVRRSVHIFHCVTRSFQDAFFILDKSKSMNYI